MDLITPSRPGMHLNLIVMAVVALVLMAIGPSLPRVGETIPLKRRRPARSECNAGVQSLTHTRVFDESGFIALGRSSQSSPLLVHGFLAERQVLSVRVDVLLAVATQYVA